MDNVNFLADAEMNLAAILFYLVVVAFGALAIRYLTLALAGTGRVIRGGMVLYRLARGRYYCRHCGRRFTLEHFLEGLNESCVTAPRCGKCGMVYDPMCDQCRWCGADLQKSLERDFPNIGAIRRIMKEREVGQIFPATISRIKKQKWQG